MLLRAGANVQRDDAARQLHAAAAGERDRQRAVIDALIAAGADPKATTASGVTPLMLASASGQADAVKTLVARGADVNAAEPTRGETALMFAAANRRTEASAR
jgi:ankyrin repeat protein